MARHFGSPSSVIFNRAQFTRYLQRPGDTVVQFLSTLRELARKCEFPPAQLDERVRDQFAAGCTNERIRERLLQETGDRTLENLELIALTIERALQEAPAFAATLVTSIDRRKQTTRTQASTPSTSCGNCGRSGHSSRSTGCPARGKQCDRCSKTGHFRSVCRSTGLSICPSSSSRNGRSRQRSQSLSNCPRSTNYVDEVQPVVDSIQSVTISMVQTSEPGTFKMVDCCLNGVTVGLLLDLGAKVCVLNSKVYFGALAAKPPLQPQIVVLRTVSGSSIPCLGCITLNVKLNVTVIRDFRFYVTEHGVSIVGVVLFDAFGGSVLLGGQQQFFSNHA